MNDNLDTDQVADPAQEPVVEGDPSPAEAPTEPDVNKLSEAQLQQVGSYAGRIAAEQIDKKVMPLIQNMQQPQPQAPSGTPGNLNEELQEMIFAGDVTGAFEKFTKIQAQANTHQQKERDVATKRAVTEHSDKPYYKDIYPEMEKLSATLVSQGYPPKAAADMAYQTAKANHLESQVSGGNPSLSMSSGSPRRGAPRSTSIQLPAAFKAAAERDIAKGLFKDEADYINNLSSGIREKYGI